MYNYSLVIHDAWVFLSAIQKQMVKLYGDMNDIPEDFSNLYEKDLPMMIEYLKQWHPKKYITVAVVMVVRKQINNSVLFALPVRLVGG